MRCFVANAVATAAAVNRTVPTQHLQFRGGSTRDADPSSAAADRFASNIRAREALYATAESGSWRTNIHRERFMVLNNITHKSMLDDMEKTREAVLFGEDAEKGYATPWYLQEKMEDTKTARRKAWAEHQKEAERGRQRQAALDEKRAQAMNRMQFKGRLVAEVGARDAGAQFDNAMNSGGLEAVDELINDAEGPVHAQCSGTNAARDGGDQGTSPAATGGELREASDAARPFTPSKGLPEEFDDDGDDDGNVVFVNGMRQRRGLPPRSGGGAGEV